MQHTLGYIPYVFDYWADPAVNGLLESLISMHPFCLFVRLSVCPFSFPSVSSGELIFLQSCFLVKDDFQTCYPRSRGISISTVRGGVTTERVVGGLWCIDSYTSFPQTSLSVSLKTLPHTKVFPSIILPKQCCFLKQNYPKHSFPQQSVQTTYLQTGFPPISFSPKSAFQNNITYHESKN